MGSVNQNYHQDFLDHYLIRYKYVYITFNIIIILIILVIVIYSSELSKPVISSVILFICSDSFQQLSFGGRADVQRNPSSVVITTVIPASIIITPLENPPISECNILVKNVRLLFCVEFVVSGVSIYAYCEWRTQKYQTIMGHYIKLANNHGRQHSRAISSTIWKLSRLCIHITLSLNGRFLRRLGRQLGWHLAEIIGILKSIRLQVFFCRAFVLIMSCFCFISQLD